MENEKDEPSEFDYLSDEMQEYIINLERESRWININERLPKSSERVLIRMSNYYTIIASYFINPKYWKNDAGAIVLNVTHWKPLPQPPIDD